MPWKSALRKREFFEMRLDIFAAGVYLEYLCFFILNRKFQEIKYKETLNTTLCQRVWSSYLICYYFERLDLLTNIY